MYKQVLRLIFISLGLFYLNFCPLSLNIYAQETVEKVSFKSFEDLQEVYLLLNQESLSPKNHVRLKQYLDVNVSLLSQKRLKLEFLKAYPNLIPFLPIEENRDVIVAYLKINPAYYLKLNLIQKQDSDFIQTVFFHSGVSDSLKTTVFKFSPESMQYNLLVYDGSYLEYVEPKNQNNIDWVYRAAVQNSEAIYFASENMQRIIKLVGIMNLKRAGAFFAKFQLRLSAFSLTISDAIFSFAETISDWFRYRIIQPIYYFFGDDLYVEKLNTLQVKDVTTNVEESVSLTDYVVKSPDLYAYLTSTTLGVVEDIRLVASKGVVDLLWVKSSMFDSRDVQIGFVLRSPKRYLVFPIYGKITEGSYLFRPGDNGQWHPENIEVLQLEKKAMGFNTVLNWKSDIGDLRMRLTERRGVAVRDILSYTSKN